MTPRKAVLGAMAVVALACLIALGFSRGDPPSGTAVVASAASDAVPVRPVAGSAAGFASEPAPAASSDPSRAPEVRPLGSGEIPEFQVDARGNLISNARTRDQLERLLALNDRADALALLRQLAAVLPPAAYRQATDAFYAYQNYTTALAQAFPPGQPVTDEGGGVRQLDALHALRVQQFGEETARAYFGEEEAMARRLLADMQAQPAAGTTLEQRVERAQQQMSAASR